MDKGGMAAFTMTAPIMTNGLGNKNNSAAKGLRIDNKEIRDRIE
jgi:hypothetical protein